MSGSVQIPMLQFANFKGEPCAGVGLLVNAGSLGLESQRSLNLEERIVRLYDELREPLYRYLLCLGLVAEEVEEVIQEAFLRLYKHLHGGGREDNLRSWLYRVAHNLSVNRTKSRQYLAVTSPERWHQLTVSTSDPAPGPEEILLEKEKMTRLHNSIAALSELQRNCVYLRIEGFRYREIAAILGVGIPTVSESLRRAIVTLTRGQNE
jgi:RNA polymerase sigma-70 factor (ECF subfamily)